MSLYCPHCFSQSPDGMTLCCHCGGALQVQNRVNQLPPMTILEERYLVGVVLGESDFSITYVGYDLRVQERVAIKEYYPQGCVTRDDTHSHTVEVVSRSAEEALKQGKENFLIEARAMSRFNHLPTVVDVLDFFEANGTAYIVMEYLDGVSMNGKQEQTLLRGLALKCSERIQTLAERVEGFEKHTMPDLTPSPSSWRRIVAAVAGLAVATGFLFNNAVLAYGEANRPVITAAASEISLPTPETVRDPQQLAYEEAEALLAEGKKAAAAMAFSRLGGYKDAQEKAETLWFESGVRRALVAGSKHTAGLRSDGTVVAVGDNDNGQRDVSGWTDIVAIAAGDWHTVGLRSDGTVVAVGWNGDGQCDVSDWRDIVAIAAGFEHTVGLRSDGTVVAMGDNDCGQCEVSDWRDIVAIAAGAYHTVGLRSDGTVVATEYIQSMEYYDGQCDVSDWTDIVAISAGFSHTVGLRSDGTAVAVGTNTFGQCDVSGWTDIVAISAGGSTAGLRPDGTVVMVGGKDSSFRRCVEGWSDIVAISVESAYPMGVRSDGTVEAVEYTGEPEYNYGQLDVDGWTDILVPVNTTMSVYTPKPAPELAPPPTPQESYQAAETLLAEGKKAAAAMAFSRLGGYEDAKEKAEKLWYESGVRSTLAAGYVHTVGLCSDGTVVAVGSNGNGQCEVSGWTDIVAIAAGGCHTVGLRSDGTVVAVGANNAGQCEVSGWTDIVAIAAGEDHTVGLRSDGTVVATEYTESLEFYLGQSNVDGWTDIVAIAAAYGRTVGLRSDGTVVAVGYYYYNDHAVSVNSWRDIVAIAATSDDTMGLRSDGAVVVVGVNHFGECEVDGWTDIVAITVENAHTVGLRSDGTVVATECTRDSKYASYHGQCEVSGWTDIVAIAAGEGHTVGLRSDGTVVATEYTGESEYASYCGQCDVSGWRNIRVPG